MDYFDPFAETPPRVRPDPVKYLVLSFDSDWRFDTEHSRRIVRHLERGRLPVTFRELSSPWGHDSFLLDNDDYHATVRAYFDRALEVGL
jgi:homoserine O-acetyltransferase